LARLSGDRTLAKQVLAAFLSDAPNQVQALKKQIELGDAKGIVLRAHTLKGAAATVSALALRDLSLQIEQAARSGDTSRAVSLTALLEQELERFKAALIRSGWI
jgi:HPt (histidine-containing phosphotransfer) domain-containing protein